MFGFCKNDPYVLLITEYIPGGNLSSVIHSKRTLSVTLKIDIALSICSGMVYMENKNVIHRDLKPANILVEDLEHVKLKVCDFGLSRVKKMNAGAITETNPTFGTPHYAAPELPKSNNTTKVDVFSFSVMYVASSFTPYVIN
jgi:serine/threonine-protein kinase